MEEKVLHEKDFLNCRTWGPTPKYDRVLNYPKIEGRGGPYFSDCVVAGPCSVESEKQILEIVSVVDQFCTHIRGGCFRAGTYPGQLFGFIQEAAEALRAAGDQFKKPVVMEVLDIRQLDTVLKYADCLQVGARQMQNYTLLRELGRTGKQIFLKRHSGSTLDEFLGSAEHVLVHGKDLILVERGSSTHMNHVRWDLSISTIAAIKRMCNVPILVDASHGTGRRDLVFQMTMAGIAAGADGYWIETHPNPPKSLSDPDQAYPLEDFPILALSAQKMKRLKNELQYL